MRKTGPYLIIDKPTERTYILQDSVKERITILRNHIVSYYRKEKIKDEIQNYITKDENEFRKRKQKNTYEVVK